MPKELTHWILADKACSGLEPNTLLARIIRDHRNLYLAGAVLPDTLLHLFRGEYSSVALSLANSFHDPEGNSHAPLLRVEERCQEGVPPNLLACLLGVICHIQADIAFHPFVFALSGNDMGRHYRLETMIDITLTAKGWAPPVRHLSELVSPQVRDHLIEALSMLFDPEGKLPNDAAAMALDLHCRYQRMYDAPLWQMAAALRALLPVKRYRRQQHLFYPLLRKSSVLDGEGDWRSPVSGEHRRETVSELADAALKETLRLFKRIDDHGSLKNGLQGEPGANLLTGRHGVRKHDSTTPISDQR